MSSLSAEEKRRLLRERRQAKMAQGKASDRLNSILTQGSSVNASSAVSVLDSPASSPTPEPTAIPDGKAAEAAPAPTHTPLHDDPEVPDISLLLHQNNTGANAEEEDMDAMLLKIFANAAGGDRPPQNADEATTKFFADMMKVIAEDNPNGVQVDEHEASYQTKLDAYHVYEQRRWKARYLIARLLVHTANFWYHWAHYTTFSASPHRIIRASAVEPGAATFLTYFVSIELAIVSSYYFLLSSKGLLKTFSRNHVVSRMLSLGSSVFPQLRAYQPIIDTLMVYWGVASIILGDVMLMVVYFGVVSMTSGSYVQ